MLLPANFTQTIADTFYDKTVTKLVKTTTSTDGWVEQTGTAGSTFKANVRYTNLGAVQSDLGLTEQIDVALTCPTDVTLEADGLFQVDGTNFKATGVVPSDSHLTIVGSKWQ